MKIVRYGLVALCLILLSSHARSQTFTAYDLTEADAGSSYVGNEAWAGSVGMAFDVNAPAIKITALGVFDSGRDGFHHVLTTYLWNRDTHELISTQTFSGTTDATAGTLEGYHRFKDVAGGELILNTGHYVIAADGFADDAAGADLNGNGLIAGFVSDTFNNGGGLISAVAPSQYSEAAYGLGQYPNSTEGGALNFNAGTFQYSLFVPEPGTTSLLVSMFGVGGSFAFRRARRRRAKSKQSA